MPALCLLRCPAAHALFWLLLRPSFARWRSISLMVRRNCACRALLVEEALDKRTPQVAAVNLTAGHSRQLLWNRYIAAANSALRHVAAEESLTLMDYESIMLQLPTAHSHRSDGFHPLVRARGGLCHRVK